MENLSPEIKEKYYMYIRRECGKMSQIHLTLCGLTLAPIRAIFIILVAILWVVLLAVVCIWADLENPFP